MKSIRYGQGSATGNDAYGRGDNDCGYRLKNWLVILNVEEAGSILCKGIFTVVK